VEEMGFSRIRWNKYLGLDHQPDDWHTYWSRSSWSAGVVILYAVLQIGKEKRGWTQLE
jgi:hypothetical protein